MIIVIGGIREEKKRDAHHVPLDEVEPQGHLLDARLVRIHPAFLRVGENDVGLLVKARQDALRAVS